MNGTPAGPPPQRSSFHSEILRDNILNSRELRFIAITDAEWTTDTDMSHSGSFLEKITEVRHIFLEYGFNGPLYIASHPITRETALIGEHFSNATGRTELDRILEMEFVQTWITFPLIPSRRIFFYSLCESIFFGVLSSKLLEFSDDIEERIRAFEEGASNTTSSPSLFQGPITSPWERNGYWGRSGPNADGTIADGSSTLWSAVEFLGPPEIQPGIAEFTDRQGCPPKHEIKMEQRLTDHLTVRLEGDEVNIYIDGEKFRQCKYLLLHLDKSKTYEDIESIDDAAIKLGQTGEGERRMELDKHIIPSETEFWGHCSNLEAWIDYDYDIRLIHTNLGLPLLRELVRVGETGAEIAFKEQIMERIEQTGKKAYIMFKEDVSEFFNAEETHEVYRKLFLSKEEFIERVKEMEDIEYFRFIKRLSGFGVECDIHRLPRDNS